VGSEQRLTLDTAHCRLPTAHSDELYARALTLLPGGVNSPVRAMRAIGRDPVFVARGAGAELWDVDGNSYIDYVCSWGPLIHGHAHPEILAAVSEAASRGTTFGAPTAGEVDLAEEVAERIPSVEMLRMTSSGTEATMSVMRLARAATGRETILKFAGAYHGHVDGLLAEAGSGLATQGIPASPGVPAAAAASTVVIPWNDRAALEHATAANELAAIFAEPCPANMGLVPAADGFLELLRDRAEATGALLVFDEVISGFRVGRGGAQERAGVAPDLTIMGKVIGGGLPAAAYGGRRDLMELIAPAGDVYQAGTLSGNPLAVAAGLATLRLLDASAYERLAATTETLAAGLRAAAAAAGVAVQVPWLPGLLTVFFSTEPVVDYAGAAACDAEAYGAWCRALLERGVYPPASQFEAWFPSLAHTDEHVESTVAAARDAFAAL
jgi:glutamate-1-semialdehyde 2,1-aminomutase